MSCNFETELIADGGIQYVPQITGSQQLIYLDFDGEVTSYNGEILELNNIEIAPSQISADRINSIVKNLNNLYNEKNVVFVTERPTNGEYSTVYIGKTSAFENYGNFLGIAETIDTNNLNKSDKAFVMLDSDASNIDIVDTISHEVDHLLGNLNHGGAGLNSYGAIHYYNNLLTGDVNDNYQLSHYASDSKTDDNYPYSKVYSHYDRSENATIHSKGRITVNSDTSANNTTILDGGQMYVGSGGKAHGVVISSGGLLEIQSEDVKGVRVCNGGVLSIYSGKFFDLTFLIVRRRLKKRWGE